MAERVSVDTLGLEAVPSFWEMLWLVLMQPVRLHRRLRVHGIDEIQPIYYSLSSHHSLQAANRQYALRLHRVILSIIPVGALLMAMVLRLGATIPELRHVVLGFTLGIYTGLFAALSGGVIMEPLAGVGLGVMAGICYGVLTSWIPGLEFGVALVVALYRIPQYLTESLLGIILYAVQLICGFPTLSRTPVLFNELSYFPYPLLKDHIVKSALVVDATLIRRVLDACAIAPGQRRVGRSALVRLQALDLKSLGETGQFTPAVALESKWLPGVQGASPILLSFRELSRYLAAARSSSNPYYQLNHLEQAKRAVRALKNQLLSEKPYVVDALTPTFEEWQLKTETLYRESEAAAEKLVPNPFRADAPLSPDSGSEVFRGREAVIDRVRSLLFDSRMNYSIAILAPRRFGKTSLLKMLPGLVPDAIFVFFDLQANPVDSPEAFLRALSAQTVAQSQNERRVVIPPLPNESTFEAASQWIDLVEHALGELRLIFCLDEFEVLEKLFPRNEIDLIKLMGLFRGIIQHRKRVRLLIAGAAPFDRLPIMWNDYFINLQEVRFGPLDVNSARGLLMTPSISFPRDTLDVRVADTIIERTGCQPFLLQLYASGIVSLLNDENRKTANVEDVYKVERSILTEGQAIYYFRDIYYRMPIAVRVALARLVRYRDFTLDRATSDWLNRRYLLTNKRTISIPVFGAWLEQETAGGELTEADT